MSAARQSISHESRAKGVVQPVGPPQVRASQAARIAHVEWRRVSSDGSYSPDGNAPLCLPFPPPRNRVAMSHHDDESLPWTTVARAFAKRAYAESRRGRRDLVSVEAVDLMVLIDVLPPGGS